MSTPPDASRKAPPVPALLRAYAAARYYWQHAGEWHPFAVGRPVPALERLHPGVGAFGAISAWNPRSVQREESANREADRELHAQLAATGRPLCPAYASAGDRTWREPGWIVMGLPVGEFDALLRRFGQLAGVWWTRGGAARLRADAARPAGFDGDEWIDWLR